VVKDDKYKNTRTENWARELLRDNQGPLQILAGTLEMMNLNIFQKEDGRMGQSSELL
jgi:hypothetical protein